MVGGIRPYEICERSAPRVFSSAKLTAHGAPRSSTLAGTVTVLSHARLPLSQCPRFLFDK